MPDSTFTPPTCTSCGRTRRIGDSAHPMDAYDYSPLQALTGQPFGWYNGADAGEGDQCPECFTKLFEDANGPRR